MKPTPLATALAAVLMLVTTLQTSAQDAPFIGVVIKDAVEVRSGAGRAYYTVGDLKKGDMVRVEKVLFNQTWYQIRVPQDMYSYVSKAFVDAQGDGETGTINADRTEFKAGSKRGPGESYRVQGTLSKGDTVTILSEEGNFYKITPPEGAFVFIPADKTLRQATADDLQAAGGADEGTEDQGPTNEPDDKNNDDTDQPTEPVKPVEPIEEQDTTDTTPGEATDDNTNTEEPGDAIGQQDKTQPDTEDPAPEASTEDSGPDQTPDTTDSTTDTQPTKPAGDGWPQAPKVKVDTPARSEALKRLELKVLPYFSLPVEEQPLDKMAAAYQELKAGDLPNIDEQIIEVRLRVIERRQQIVSTMQQAKAAQKSTQARTVIPAKEDLEPLPDRFTAVGLLMPSTVYDGGSLPLLYRVVDASPSARTLAYVAPTDKADLNTMLNQLVGIVGETQYDRTLKLNIIEINRIIALEAEAETEAAEDEATEESEAETEAASE